MAFEVIDREQRLARAERQPLARKQRDHHAADQSRPRGRGDGVDVGDALARLAQNPADEVGQDLDMRPRRDLRDHSAERPVRLVLADDRLGEDLPVAGDQRGGGVVAGGFEAEDQRHLPRLCRRRRRSASGALCFGAS